MPGVSTYDPFAPGPFQCGVRTSEARDTERNRVFPCEIWRPLAIPEGTQCDDMEGLDAPAAECARALVLFSHSSGGDRRQSASLCAHLATHGYVVAALDHSEKVAPRPAPAGESIEERSARWSAIIADRVPDVRLLHDHILEFCRERRISIDPARIGIVGHSFGGWTALAAVDVTPDIRSVVALAPGGASVRRPGILPLELSFAWGRDVPTLYLAAENDSSMLLAGMIELFERTPARKRMVVLHRADHLHFMDEVERLHEAARSMTVSGDLAQILKDMRPIAELQSGEAARLFVRGLTLAHLDATLRDDDGAHGFWAGDVAVELARRGVEAFVHEATDRQ